MEFGSRRHGFSVSLHVDCSRCVQIFAKEMKDVPEWMKDAHNWQNAVSVDKLRVSCKSSSVFC